MTRSPGSGLHRRTAHWPTGRRIAAVTLVITVLAALSGLAAWVTADEDERPTAAPPGRATSTPDPAAEDLPGPDPSSGSGPVAQPPEISDPLAYARKAAAMLWSYDTRSTSRDQQLAGMRAWMSPETKYTDWDTVRALVPDPVLWSRMSDNAQHATATVTDSVFPSAFKQALAEDPAALTEAYVYAVTVTGKQTIRWKGGGGGAEVRAVTLAVQCRPSATCTLVSVAPGIAP
ncbi:hypothetical protein [Streptomyces sp. NPDC088789]|uniref:hypothetical protein n=1 Tax=Streptomyces sp. NPDC088789 TaxID=3365899 RepID=UPI003800AF62